MHMEPQLSQVKRMTSKSREVTENSRIAIIPLYSKKISVWNVQVGVLCDTYVDKLIQSMQLNEYDVNTVCAAIAIAVED